MIKIKTRSLLKKTACAALSVGIAFSYMPLNSYAMSSSPSENIGSEASPIDSIEPGQVFTSGTYEIQKDIEVIQDKPGGNGIEVQGKVKFVLNNHTVKIKAGDAKGMTGGGAGVYVPKGNTFFIEGQGTFDVKGGDATYGESGYAGGDSEFIEYPYFLPNILKSGYGGEGGNGGGGAGAAIGTSGGKGGMGAMSAGWSEYSLPCFFSSGGIDGCNGRMGECSASSGDFALLGDVKLIANGGRTNEKQLEGGKFGGDLTLIKRFPTPFPPLAPTFYFTCTGGSGGGAGGCGYAASNVGSGGSGGSGGGSGGIGAFDSTMIKGHVAKGNGGGGGAGQGCVATVNGGGKIEYNDGLWNDPAEQGKDSDVLHPGDGGKAGCICKNIKAGNGGNGGTVQPSGKGGKFYCDNRAYSKNGLSESANENDFIGEASTPMKIVRESDCRLRLKSAPPNDVYEYTGKPIEPEIEVCNIRTGEIMSKDTYEVKYFDNTNVGEASIEVHGLKPGEAGIPTIFKDSDFEACGVVKKHFMIKYGVKITGMEVESKRYDAKKAEPVGEPKFTRVDDPSIIVKDKLPMHVNYYDKEGNLLKEAPCKVGKYQYEVVVDLDAENYAGTSGKHEFVIYRN